MSEEETIDRTLGVIGIGLYSITLCVVFFTISYRLRERYRKTTSWNVIKIRTIYKTYLVIFFLARIIWTSLLTFHGHDDITFAINQFTTITYLLAFILGFCYWRDVKASYLNQTPNPSHSRTSGMVFIALNILLYGAQTLATIYLLLQKERESDLVRKIDVGCDALLSLLCAFGFIFCGFSLIQVIQSQGTEAVIVKRTRKTLGVLIITLTFAALFFLRSFMFMYHLVTNQYFAEEIFYIFGYFLVDILPTLEQLTLIELNQQQERNDSLFIDQLYNHTSVRSPLVLNKVSDETYFVWGETAY
eukprot:TRINITY_DN8641_c2_g1_i1.p1 TRINITY_DN8641_c2_g1~~TRINITY_DN8641_c2_g1_i1.p1  ORF type:complete len:303 (-),score=38.91 TRINITY_DN8641_c2_g1_i1:50-958(-)